MGYSPLVSREAGASRRCVTMVGSVAERRLVVGYAQLRRARPSQFPPSFSAVGYWVTGEAEDGFLQYFYCDHVSGSSG